MATHPDQPPLSGRHASLFVLDDFLDYEAATVDPREAQDGFDREAIELDEGLRHTFRPFERTFTGFMLAISIALLGWMLIGVTIAAIAGRL